MVLNINIFDLAKIASDLQLACEKRNRLPHILRHTSMSIVPYNNELLYHDPKDGILVLHNNRELIVLIVPNVPPDTMERGQPRLPYRDSFNGNESTTNHTCPNCGFSWSDFDRRRSSSTHSKEYRDFSQRFMHHDYFKLLARLPSGTEFTTTESPFSLPKELFNQGYFQRFFKKIPPFTLGSGANAQVYKVAHVLNDIKLGTYAVKRILIGDKLERLEQVLNEVFILYEMSMKGANENLIRYNHVWMELGNLDDLRTFIFSNDSKVPDKVLVPYVYILQQYCGGGNLDELISGNFDLDAKLSWKERVLKERKRRKSLSREEQPWLSTFEVWKFFKDVVNGVNYLHENGILHRDLKPSNCLLDAPYTPIPGNFSFRTARDLHKTVREMPRILVSDFGEGKFLNKRNLETSHFQEERRQGNTGTLEFTAPELWLFSDSVFVNDFTFESDVYSLGLILCYLCVGKLPFSDLVADELDPHVVRSKIMDWYFEMTEFDFNEWWNLSRVTKDCDCFAPLVYLMIKGEDTNRMRASDVLNYLVEMETSFIEDNTLSAYRMNGNQEQSPDSTSILKNPGSEILKNSNSEILKNSNSEIQRNSNSEILKKSSSEILKNSSSEILKSPGSEILKSSSYDQVILESDPGGGDEEESDIEDAINVVSMTDNSTYSLPESNNYPIPRSVIRPTPRIWSYAMLAISYVCLEIFTYIYWSTWYLLSFKFMIMIIFFTLPNIESSIGLALTSTVSAAVFAALWRALPGDF